jgi:hypothetical protein
MRVIELAYLAGLFDGDGYFGYYMLRTSVIPRFVVINTYTPVLHQLQKQFGGHVATPRVMKEGWKPFCYWTISNRRAVDLLLSLEPWIIIKSGHIELAKYYLSVAPGRGRWNRWNPEHVNEIFRRCKELNKKGTKK